MVRLLFHALAHVYAVHFHQLIELQLHPHLNSLFLHFVSFLITSNIIPSDYSSVSNNPNGSTQSITPTQSDVRELRAELESLDGLYRLLADNWRHAYREASTQRRKAANNE